MSDVPLIENYNPKNIILGKLEERQVKFFIRSETNPDEFGKIRFQIPRMRIAFDIDEKKTAQGRTFVKNISFSTNENGSSNNKKRIEIFRKKIEKTEKYIKKLLPDSLKDKQFSPSLWQGKNLDYKPIFKTSISFNKDEETKAGIYDDNNNLIDHNLLEKGQYASAVIRLDKVWIWKNKIGINWEIEQIKIYDTQQPTRVDDDDDKNRKPRKVMIIRKE